MTEMQPALIAADNGRISLFASLLRGAYKLSGAKKAFALPEEPLRRVMEKQNRHRGVFTPTDRKACYETITVNGSPCLIVREHPQPSKRAILYFFGGGMVIGPDRGDLPVMRKLMRETGCDVWFPFYPLCTEHCIRVCKKCTRGVHRYGAEMRLRYSVPNKTRQPTRPMEAEMLSECASRKQFDFSLQPFDKSIYFLVFPIRGCKAKISSSPSVK